MNALAQAGVGTDIGANLNKKDPTLDAWQRWSQGFLGFGQAILTSVAAFKVGTMFAGAEGAEAAAAAEAAGAEGADAAAEAASFGSRSVGAAQTPFEQMVELEVADKMRGQIPSSDA